jgi:DNA-binding Lrp family transcriptional regulator
MNRIHLDATDRAILILLQQDAKLNNKEIAAQLDKSTSAINERIHRLKRNKVIKSYSVILNQDQLPPFQTVYSHIQLKIHTKEVAQEFMETTRPFPEIISCNQVTGPIDFILKILTNDLSAYYRFLHEKIIPLPYIGLINTYVSISEGKNETIFPPQLLMICFAFKSCICIFLQSILFTFGTGGC